jgi:RNA polymerase sigma-70 factor (ECF subfamily)
MADQERFLTLYFENEYHIKSFLRVLVRDQSDYEDVCQSVALTLWRKIDSYDDSRPFGPWARGVAMREVLQMRRDAARCPTPFPAEVVTGLLEAFERHIAVTPDYGARMEALKKCLEALPTKSRKVVQLRYGDSISIADVARRVGSTTAAAQRALSRIRARLADCIGRRLSIVRETSE